MSFGKTLSASIVYNVQTSLNLSKALVVGHVTTALGHVINILAHNHTQCCKKTQRHCKRTCSTLEGELLNHKYHPNLLCVHTLELMPHLSGPNMME